MPKLQQPIISQIWRHGSWSGFQLSIEKQLVLYLVLQDCMTLHHDRFALHLYDEISGKYCQIRLPCSICCVKWHDAQKKIAGENKMSCSWYLHRFHITPKQRIQSLECACFIQYSTRFQYTIRLKLLYVRQQASKRLLKAPVQDKMWRVHNVVHDKRKRHKRSARSRSHYAGEIWKRGNHRPFWICI